MRVCQGHWEGHRAPVLRNGTGVSRTLPCSGPELWLPASPQLSAGGGTCVAILQRVENLQLGPVRHVAPPESGSSLPPHPPISITSRGANRLPALPFSPVEARVPGPRGKARPEVHPELPRGPHLTGWGGTPSPHTHLGKQQPPRGLEDWASASRE